MKFFFLLMLAVTVVSSVFMIRSDKKGSKFYFGSVGFVIAIILGCADLFGAMDDSPFRGTFTIMGAASALQLLLFFFKLKSSDKPTFNRISKAVIAAVLLELIVFQIPSIPTNFIGKYKPVNVNIADTIVGNGFYDANAPQDGIKTGGTDIITLEYNKLNCPVGSVKIETKLSETVKYMDASISLKDQTVSTLRSGIATGRVVRGVDESQYIQCSVSGNVDRLLIDCKFQNNSNETAITGIIINAPMPFEASLIRFLLIVALAALVVAVTGAKAMQKSVEEKKGTFRLYVIELTIAAVTVAVLMCVAIAHASNMKHFFKGDIGDQLSQQLVESFENGRLDIDAYVSPDLTALENPYQWDARDGIAYEWDHLLYDGKYYSYYGIAPVILVYLPFHKLTGKFMTQVSAIMIFTIIGLILLSMAYYAFIKRFFGKIPVGCAVAGHVVMLVSCGIWFNTCQPIFYEAAISAGFAAMTAAVYFLFTSGVFTKDKLSLPRTALSSLFFGIAVMCRPTLAVYAICAYIIYGMHLKQADFISADKSNKKRRIYYALCGALPLAILGICQMAYNYARFGSPFDFGIQYSLTINDFTHSEFHINFMLLGLFYYLIAPPMLKGTYPYITNDFSQFGINGYYYRCPETAAGIIFLAMPTLGFLFSRKALRALPDRKARIRALLGVGLPCLVMPIVIICSIWESGYAVRYFADFAWEIVFGGLCILFFLYNRSKNETHKKQFKWFMAAAAVVAVVLNAPMVYGVMCPRDYFPELSEKFSRIVAFWQ